MDPRRRDSTAELQQPRCNVAYVLTRLLHATGLRYVLDDGGPPRLDECIVQRALGRSMQHCLVIATDGTTDCSYHWCHPTSPHLISCRPLSELSALWCDPVRYGCDQSERWSSRYLVWTRSPDSVLSHSVETKWGQSRSGRMRLDEVSDMIAPPSLHTTHRHRWSQCCTRLNDEHSG